MPENDNDVVVMKQDGLPTYHFAHAIDDHLMGTTHVIRADEWMPSVPLHFELFDILDFPRLFYGHIAPINKIDEDGSRRKLSKRKDPEANVEYYQRKGYPPEAVIDYLMNLANSEYEDWRKTNPDTKYTEFELTFYRLSQSTGPLFDEIKLQDIAKEVISRHINSEFYEKMIIWSEKYDQDFHIKLTTDKEYWLAVFNIERDSSKRKDISTWGQVYDFYQFMDKDAFGMPNWDDFQTPLSLEEINTIKSRLVAEIDQINTSDKFMNLMRLLAKEFGLAESIKELKVSNGVLRGHVGLITQVVRYCLTGRVNTPDLFQIITVLGKDEVIKRCSKVC